MRRIFMAICCVALLLSSGTAFAEADGDDQTPEQKELMQTIEEREKIAVQEERESTADVSPDDDLMYAKEKDRAARIREEEPKPYEEWYQY
jgi:hypothetical protein